MSFETYFNLVSYLALYAGFLALVLTGQVGMGTILAYSAVLTASYLADVKLWVWRLPRRVAWFVPWLAGPLFLLDWQFLSGAPLGALVRLILILSVVKLYREKRDRDWLFLYILSLFEVLLAAATSINVWFLGLLVVYVLALLLTLTATEVRRARRLIEPVGEVEVLSSPKRHRPRLRMVQPLLRASIALLALSLALATPFFIFMPRPSRAWLGQGAGAGQTLTGFSDVVGLGDVTSIKKNRQVVMRVKAEGAGRRALQGVRWRGLALNEYKDNHWRNTLRAYEVSRQGRGRGAPQYFAVDSVLQGQAELTRLTFYVEPLASPVVFAARRPIVLEGGLRRLARDDAGSLFTEDRSASRLTYTVYSDRTVFAPDRLRLARRLRPQARSNYTTLPPDFDSRVRQLALTVTRGATNDFDRAAAIEYYLRTEFQYSLDLTRTAEPDPVVDFLFNLRRGHCEYFATGMTLMLRSLDVPARMVNGFQTGEYNSLTDTFTVRQSDAHSWVEVYLPVDGPESAQWVEFDPTPPDGQGGDEAGVMSTLRRLADAIEFFWQEHIVAYDTQQQVTIWQMFEGQLLSWKRSLVSLYQGVSLRLAAFKVQGWAAPGAVVAVFVALLLIPGALLVARRANRFGWLGHGCSRVLNFLLRRRPSYRDSACLYYDQMQHLLAQKGIVRAPGQTPLELAVSTGLAEVLQLTTAYNRIRFGGGEVSRDEVMQLSETLAALRRQLGLERPRRFLWGRQG